MAAGTAKYGDAQVEDCKEASCSQGCGRSHAKRPHGEGQVLHMPKVVLLQYTRMGGVLGLSFDMLVRGGCPEL